MLIIAIVVFGLGLAFLGKLFGGAEKIKSNLDSQTEARIKALLQDGSRVAVPLNSKTIERGKNDIFGLGVLNVQSDGEDTFSVMVDCLWEGSSSKDKIKVLHERSFTLKNNEQKIVNILIDVGKEVPSETYICDVCVKRGGNALTKCDSSIRDKLYDKTIHKIYVKV